MQRVSADEAVRLIRSGDKITINAETNSISVDLSDQELAERKKLWKMPPYKSTRGTLGKYIRLVKNASFGCVTDEMRQELVFVRLGPLPSSPRSGV